MTLDTIVIGEFSHAILSMNQISLQLSKSVMSIL
jgi:hypothetical protein